MNRGLKAEAELETQIALMRSYIYLAGARLSSAKTPRARRELIRRITLFAERLQALLMRRANRLPN